MPVPIIFAAQKMGIHIGVMIGIHASASER
jgi:hypothetical protein